MESKDPFCRPESYEAIEAFFNYGRILQEKQEQLLTKQTNDGNKKDQKISDVKKDQEIGSKQTTSQSKDTDDDFGETCEKPKSIKVSELEYVKVFQKELEQSYIREFSKQFSSLNITGISQGTTIGYEPSEAAFSETADLFNLPKTDIKSQINGDRKDLSIFKFADEIINQIENHPVTLICGPTGCGKSTQVPQYIYDSCTARGEPVNIIISQPRKIAAISVAQRVAQERDTPIGTLVGHQVGLNKCINLSDHEPTQITFCTTGVILQKLIHNKTMSRYTHIILDEVHERDVEIDFLITIIRRLMPTNSSTKVILMSATLDIDKFQDYFKIPIELEGEYQYPPVIDLDITIRKYPIKEYFLNDLRSISFSPEIVNEREPGITKEMYGFVVNLIALLLTPKKRKNDDGVKSHILQNILVFLPGLYEIERLEEELEMPENQKKLKVKPEIHILHSSLSIEEQKQVFINTSGKPKVILSSNIAESSVTIPNVAYVIDFCLTKFLINPKGSQMSTLCLGWASKNNCQQRAGRTGRVGRGVVYRMVFKTFYERRMLEYSLPEIRLIPLESVVVKIKQFDMGTPLEILALSMDPPDKSAVVNAVLTLKEHGGLYPYNRDNKFEYDDGELTYLGDLMAALPCDVRTTKLIFLGYMFSVLEEAIIIAAGLNIKGIFPHSLRNKLYAYTQKIRWSQGSCSDSFATLNAYREWNDRHSNRGFKSVAQEKSWCHANGLDLRNLREMRLWITEIKERLKEFKIIELPSGYQPRWTPKEKEFVIKIVMAGAFGVSNFFENQPQDDTDREPFKLANNLDTFRTVYFRNMDKSVIGDVYKTQLKRILTESGVCDEKTDVDILFDSSSQRVYVTFDHLTNDRDHESFDMGTIMPEVYKAVKLRQIQGSIKLALMSEERTLEYALEQTNAKCELRKFELKYPCIKRPECFAFPTFTTIRMEGYVTYVENCSEFYFCPLSTYNTTKEIKDNRYAKYVDEIKAKIETAEIAPISQIFKTAKKGQMVLYKDHKNRSYERAKLLKSTFSNTVNIKLVDRGDSIEVSSHNVFWFKNSSLETELKERPPLVFKCKIREIRPSHFASYSGKWTSQAIHHFRQNVMKKMATIEIYSVLGDVAIVDLITVDGSLSTHWNKELVNLRYAEECEETFFSRLNHLDRMINNITNEKPKAPEDAFYDRIDQDFVKENEIKEPPETHYVKNVSLIGPFSLLETSPRAICRNIIGSIKVDVHSVNSVMLNDDILDLHRKSYIAADVSYSGTRNHIKLSETTAMPNLPGLLVLLGLIFAPVSQLRRDKTKTRYVSLITGLGYDKENKKPYYPERDAVQYIDFDLSFNDIVDINHLRMFMGKMIYRKPYDKYPDLNDKTRETALQSIKKFLLLITHKNRAVVDTQVVLYPFTWDVDQGDNVEYARGEVKGSSYDPISIPKLNTEEKDNQDLIKHVKSLEDNNTMFIRECELCGKPLQNDIDIKIHLLSKMHQNRKAQLGIK